MITVRKYTYKTYHRKMLNETSYANFKITEDSIEFDNSKYISFDHYQECCEISYADFEQLDSLAREVDFSEQLVFESCDYGFRFGNPPINMFFVPCYSI